MRKAVFAVRTAKEILRDPLNIAFGLGFPIVILVLLSVIQSNIPVELFEIDSLAPGVTIFGLSFMTLFSATLISKDRQGAFLQRLFTTPLTAADYIMGYTLPLLPIAFCQGIICYAAAIIMGLRISVNILLAALAIIPISLFFTGLGLLCGSVLNDKQAGGICGALFTNLTAFLSGIWFDLDLLGDLKEFAFCLPFVHAVEIERSVVSGNYDGFSAHVFCVACYAVIVNIVSVYVFTRKMKCC